MFWGGSRPIWGSHSDTSDFSAVDGALALGRAELEHAETRLQGLQSRRVGIQAIQSERDQLAAQLKSVTAENEQLRSSHQELTSARCDLAKQQHDYNALVLRSTRWEAEQIKLHATIADLRAELEGLRGIAAGGALREEETAAAELELAQLRGLSSELTNSVERWRLAEHDAQQLRATVLQLQAQLSAAGGTISQLQAVGSEASVHRELQDLAAELAKAMERARDRRQGHARLHGVLEKQRQDLNAHDAAVEALAAKMGAMNVAQRESDRQLREQQQQILGLAADQGSAAPEGSEIAVFIKLQETEARIHELEAQLREANENVEAMSAKLAGWVSADEANRATARIAELELQLLHATEHAEDSARQLTQLKDVHQSSTAELQAELEQTAAQVQADCHKVAGLESRHSQLMSELEAQLAHESAARAEVEAELKQGAELVELWQTAVYSAQELEVIDLCFDKYDIDDSGLIDSTEELSQLCLNLLFKLGIDNVDGQPVNSAVIDGLVSIAPDPTVHPLSLAQVKYYFYTSFFKTAATAQSRTPDATAQRTTQGSGEQPVHTSPPVGSTQNDGLDVVHPLPQEMHPIAEQLFEKYDLDDSGLIDSTEELSQLCLNLLFKLGIDKVNGQSVNGAWVNDQVLLMPNLSSNPLDPAAFKIWFGKTCIQHD